MTTNRRGERQVPPGTPPGAYGSIVRDDRYGNADHDAPGRYCLNRCYCGHHPSYEPLPGKWRAAQPGELQAVKEVKED